MARRTSSSTRELNDLLNRSKTTGLNATETERLRVLKTSQPNYKPPSVNTYQSGGGQTRTSTSAKKLVNAYNSAGSSLFRQGDRGQGVRNLQNLLNQAGFNLNVDGVFGPNTANAVRQYQQAAGLSVDGIAGKNTLSSLRSGNVTATPGLPSTGTDLGGGIPNGPVGDFISGLVNNPGNPTVPVYNQRDPKTLKKEVSTAANAIFTPIIQALEERQQQYETARQLGRLDIAEQYAQQIADLEALAERTAKIIEANAGAVAGGYNSAIATLAESTQAAQASSGALYDETQNRFVDEINALGLQSRVPTEGSDIVRDKAFADALIQNTGQIGETGMRTGAGIADTALAMLASNAAAQSESLQGRARVIRDQDLRSLDMDALNRIIEGTTQLGQAQSEKQAWAYDALRALENQEWQRYMESAALNWGQMQDLNNQKLQGAGILADLLGDSGSGGDSQKANLTNYGFADQYLQNQLSNFNAKDQERIQDIWSLLGQARYNAPAYDWQGAEVPAGSYLGLPNASADQGPYLPGYAIRAQRSIYDPSYSWQNAQQRAAAEAALLTAIDYAINSNKSYTLG